jgi:TorA maturation chaperone TorD
MKHRRKDLMLVLHRPVELAPHSRQLAVARKKVEKHVLHWHQLYEQQKKKKATSEEMALILDCYVNRWQR